MAQRPIREYSAKNIISKHWQTYFPHFNYSFQSALVKKQETSEDVVQKNPWVQNTQLVVKPDMLFGKRGKNQLVYLKDQKPGDVSLSKALDWISQKSKEPTTLLCGTQGELDTFILEPFCPIENDPEYYLCLSLEPKCDQMLISTQGGVDIESNWDSVHKIEIDPSQTLEETKAQIEKNLPKEIEDTTTFTELLIGFYQLFKELHFAYLEFNPFILKGKEVHLLDTVARIDDTAGFLMDSAWGPIDFPPPFGQKEQTAIEQEIKKIDEKSGASLKLTILNPKGLVWTLVAGGGASVVYADTIANIWGASEIANYGEYSGNPTKSETHLYAKGVLELMCESPDEEGRGKILIIGGSIANFTDVAKTFDGIIQAFEEMHEKMKQVGTRIFVRRGGPNYEIGLRNIETAANRLGLPIEVYGPETHLTDIVQIAKQTQTAGVTP